MNSENKYVHSMYVCKHNQHTYIFVPVYINTLNETTQYYIQNYFILNYNNISEYNDYFQINYNSSKWYIKIQKTLDDDIILKNSELVMTLTASIFGNTEKNEATLVINLPHDSYIEPPTFSKTYYTATYPQEGSGVIEFEDPIEFTNVNDISTITLTLDSKYYATTLSIIRLQ